MMRTQNLACGAVVALSGVFSAILMAADMTSLAKFDDGSRPKQWLVNVGHWEPAGGVLVCRELEKDQHAAASRWHLPLRDGVVKLKLKFSGAKFFHVGFDPAPGQLKKQGHLYSLVVTPAGAQLKKHKDKAVADSKDQTLATGSAKLPVDWIAVVLRTEGDKVTATVGDAIKLEASDPSFHVAKPAVVFRVGGGDLLLDDVEVTVTKAGEPAATKNAAGKKAAPQ